MAIDIQQPNYSGLVALAGKNAALNIAPTGALGLQALQQRQSNDASLRADALARMQMAQQGQLGLLSNQTQNRALDLQDTQQQRQGLLDQNNLLMRQQEFGQKSAQDTISNVYNQQQLAQQGSHFNQEIELRNRIQAEDTAKRQMAEMMEEKKEALHEKGAAASYGLIALSNAKSPEEAHKLSVELMKDAVTKKLVSEKEADAFLKAPLTERINMLKYKVMQTGFAKEMRDLREATEVKETGSGSQTITLPDGTVIQSSTPTDPVKGQVQKDVIFAEDNVKQLRQVVDSVPDNFFGAAAYKQTATAWREWGEKIPGIGPLVEPDAKDKSELESYSGLQGKIRNLAMNTIKQLSGLSYTDKQLEFMNDLIPQIGPNAVKSEFRGKAKNLLSFYEEIKRARQELLKEGIGLEDPRYEDQMTKKMNAIHEQLVKPQGIDEAERQFYKRHGKTDAEIDEYFKLRKK